jgi:hypothetical protein
VGSREQVFDGRVESPPDGVKSVDTEPSAASGCRASVRRSLVAVVAGAFLAVVPAAHAKTWFGSVGGKSFRAGATVATAIAGCRRPCPVRGTHVYLSPAHREEARLRVGTVDSAGRLRFVVPDLRPGSYRLVARPSNRHRPLPVSAPFRVE